ncbi:Phosphoglucomutase/phosphomannomutase, C-terminal domain family [Synechococcus sp. PCC 7335]|uniref:phosphoglucomutase/phosphomannomutase family protein n=1 Tax=Synechococcus sp. (strain ATCC 29403 / PCC 7335) TaxID=91464 RepID=UPI00017EE033|nr:phosphoglucomutase/phosphomannomutase family protein [Synechococcus sp. PCC 7335]EDX87799.1 Phosphoglucomutase/phosphomannomutase, C-terminal domain family [Synechococcus sp. PCC 7335]
MASVSPSTFVGKPIKFGTDGWRGVMAADFTFDRVGKVAALAAQVLEKTHGSNGSKTVIVGYDRRFLSSDFARYAAESVAAAGYEVMLSECFAPTPAFSWAAFDQKALGAIVITASHNPAVYNGLKIKSAFGGSVPPEVTKQVEAMLDQAVPMAETPGQITSFDPWPSYCAALRSMVDIKAIQKAVDDGRLTVFAEVMHGAAATGVGRLLEREINEIDSEADPLFAGGAPEPLPKYIPNLFEAIKKNQTNGLTVGLIFDGDSDRIAGMDGNANFLSSQVLIPILMEHLTQRRGMTGEVVKTISGSNLFPALAKLYELPLYETPIGYKYIADRMLEANVLIGGEESGGIGYGHHIPERDALLSALYLLEAVVQSGKDFGELNDSLREQTGFSSAYDRIDLPLANMEVRAKLLEALQSNTPEEVAGKKVDNCLTIDGYKFNLEDNSWLLIRFSGTEPVLRLYSEASSIESVHEILNWAKDWANSVS